MPTVAVGSSPTEKVMVFIDGSNVFWSARARGLYVDYVKLTKILVGSNRRLVRPYFYCAVGVPPKQTQIKFQDKMKYCGFAVITKSLRRRVSKARLVAVLDPQDGKWKEQKKKQWVKVEKDEEKGVDVALATDMLSMAYKNAYDTAILVGGDEDYLSTVENIKMIPKRVEIAAFSDNDTQTPQRWTKTICRDMIMVADQFYPLEKLIKQIKL